MNRLSPELIVFQIVLRTPGGPILSMCHVFDAEGNELVQDIDRCIYMFNVQLFSLYLLSYV